MKHQLVHNALVICVATAFLTGTPAKAQKPRYFGDLKPQEPADKGKNTAVVPVSKLEDGGFDWDKRHQELVSLQKTAKPRIVMIGDSITQFWAGEPVAQFQNGPEAWQVTFGACPVLNMGFAWDRTQNVMWRLDHGEFDAIRPKTAVINVGMNNFIETEHARANTPKEIAEAIMAICARIRAKSAQTSIIVMGVLPRGDNANSEFRAPIQALNVLLAKMLAGKQGILFLDIGAQFLAKDGSLQKELMVDDTHPNEKGYTIWGNALIKAGILQN